jgi:hypothetical protein
MLVPTRALDLPLINSSSISAALIVWQPFPVPPATQPLPQALALTALCCCVVLLLPVPLLACRDMLRFADADEAEAVYSMVSLTQAAHRQQQQQQQGDWLHSSTPAAHIQGPVIEVRRLRHTWGLGRQQQQQGSGGVGFPMALHCGVPTTHCQPERKMPVVSC